MKNITYPTNKTYWIAHNTTVFHIGICDDDNVTSTNMPYLLKYTTKEGFVDKCTELKIVIPETFFGE